VVAASVLLATAPSADATSAPPLIHHVFVINLENEGYDVTFGPNSPAPYLSSTLPSMGALLTQYYGIGHHSLDNYIAQISGQAPTPSTQNDCPTFNDVTPATASSDGQVVGDGCVYPSSVNTIANQLTTAGLTWHGYMQDMGNTPSREATTCGHPALGSADNTQVATPNDMYATRHNPFVYFHSIIDNQAYCNANVVALTNLSADLQSVSTTPNLSYITPNLCNDGHDAPCANGQPGGLVQADNFLRTIVPEIMSSPAYRADGMLVITFDEADTDDASACCGEPTGPNVTAPGETGPGGGRIGAVVLSRYVTPGTVSNLPYNHYSLLRSMENIFGLSYLGYADSATQFGSDIYTNPSGNLPGPAYWLVASDGGIFSYGSASFHGSTGGISLNKPIVGMAATPTGNGYWLVASDGGIFAFGDAAFQGSTGAIHLNKPIVGMAATPSGKGYWLVASDGGIFAFGDAKFYGSTGAIALNKPIVGMASTPDGFGYWLVASDGGIFAFGDAAFHGSTGAIALNKPIVGMAATPSGNGYWLVASDGGIFAFGDAAFQGSTGAVHLNKPIVGMGTTPDGAGYWLVASDGGIFAFGDATFAGSAGGSPLNKPVVSLASTL
jgi:hypothetical protein